MEGGRERSGREGGREGEASMRKDAVKRCVGKRQGSPHTADTAAWVKSWNMTVSFPAFQTDCAGRRISFLVLPCVLSMRLACLTVLADQNAYLAQILQPAAL